MTKQITAAIKMTKHIFSDIWTPNDREEACDGDREKENGGRCMGHPGVASPGVDRRLPAWSCATWTSYPRCGWFATDPDYDKDKQIAGTVTVDNSCHLAGSANYVIFGVMMKLCHDEYDDRVTQAQTCADNRAWWKRTPDLDLEELKAMELVFTEGHMRTLIWAYKGHIWFYRDASGNFEAGKRWASAGYNGWPTGESTPEADRASCAVPCPLAYGSRGTRTGDFHVNWYPHGWTSSAIGP